MITKEQYIESLVFELKVIRHLASKVDSQHFEYRPTSNQRSLHELMQYISYVFASGVDAIKEGGTGPFTTWSESTPKVTLDNFDALMEKQEQHIRTTIPTFTEEMLSEEVDLYGRQTRAMHLLNGPLKWATAYKMQLFLYLKQTGQEHLNTMNLWAGMDPQPKE